MKHLLRLDSLSRDDIQALFTLTDAYAVGEGPKYGGAAALFFPSGSIRTRASFERGLAEMGLPTIVFPPETLDKPEAHADVAGYLAQFCDIAVVRHGDIGVLEALAEPNHLPIVNAMTDVNHPCEVLADLWALRRRGLNIASLRYVIVAPAESNIAGAWFDAGRALDLDLIQACPAGHEFEGVEHTESILDAVRGADVIVTDPPGRLAEIMAPFQITLDVLASAGPQSLLNPCPPFVRGREVSADVIASDHFVGYEFKQALVPVQQAVAAWCLGA